MATSPWVPVPADAAAWTPVDESPKTAEPEGFWHSLGAKLGTTADIAKQQADEFRAHPIQKLIEAAGGPAYSLAKSLTEGAKSTGGEIVDAGKSALSGNSAGVAYHGIKSIPVVGSGMDKAADQYADKDYAGMTGTLLGTAAQAAPAILGLADSAGVPRPDTSLANVASKVSPTAMKEAAGGLLQSVAHDADKIPVQLENSGDPALKLMNWQGKTQLGPTINKYLNRITNPKLGPLTYSEARDYYQLLGRLSSDEASKLPPTVQRDLTQMVVGLKQDIGSSADQVGRAADYYKGMGDYATASRLQDWYDFTKDLLTKETVKGLAKGAGVGAGGAVGYQVYKQTQK